MRGTCKDILNEYLCHDAAWHSLESFALVEEGTATNGAAIAPATAVFNRSLLVILAAFCFLACFIDYLDFFMTIPHHIKCFYYYFYLHNVYFLDKFDKIKNDNDRLVE